MLDTVVINIIPNTIKYIYRCVRCVGLCKCDAIVVCIAAVSEVLVLSLCVLWRSPGCSANVVYIAAVSEVLVLPLCVLWQSPRFWCYRCVRFNGLCKCDIIVVSTMSVFSTAFYSDPLASLFRFLSLNALAFLLCPNSAHQIIVRMLSPVLLLYREIPHRSHAIHFRLLRER